MASSEKESLPLLRKYSLLSRYHLSQRAWKYSTNKWFPLCLHTYPTFIPFLNWLLSVDEKRKKKKKTQLNQLIFLSYVFIQVPATDPWIWGKRVQGQRTNTVLYIHFSTSVQGSLLYLLLFPLWISFIKLYIMWYKNTYNKVSFSTIKWGKNILNNNTKMLMLVWRN